MLWTEMRSETGRMEQRIRPWTRKIVAYSPMTARSYRRCWPSYVAKSKEEASNSVPCEHLPAPRLEEAMLILGPCWHSKVSKPPSQGELEYVGRRPWDSAVAQAVRNSWGLLAGRMMLDNTRLRSLTVPSCRPGCSRGTSWKS